MKTRVLTFFLAAAVVAGPAFLIRALRSPAATGTVPPVVASASLPKKGEVAPASRRFAAAADASVEEKLRAAETLAAVPVDRLPGLCRKALSLPKNERQAELVALLRRWAESDGFAAMKWGRDHLYGKEEWMQCFLNTGAAWAACDSAGLEKWFHSPAGEENWAPVGQGFDTTVMGWLAPSDVVAVARLAIADRGHTADYISNLLRGHIHTAVQTEAIAALVESNMPPPPERRTRRTNDGRVFFLQRQGQRFESAQVLKALEQRWPEIDPEGWAQWVERHPVSITGPPHALVAALKVHESTPCEAAANTALAAAPPDLQPDTAARIVELWAGKDPAASGHWLNAQGLNETTGSAVEAYAWRAVDTDPAAAFAWLSSLPESAGREALLLTHFRQWHRRQPKAAESFLSTAGWPAERMEHLRLLAIFDDR